MLALWSRQVVTALVSTMKSKNLRLRSTRKHASQSAQLPDFNKTPGGKRSVCITIIKSTNDRDAVVSDEHVLKSGIRIDTSGCTVGESLPCVIVLFVADRRSLGHARTRARNR